MGRLLRTVSLCIWVAASVTAASNSARVDGVEFDFGYLPPNGTAVHRVWIHPGEQDTLRLVNVKTACGCLTTPWTETQILPGDSLPLLFYWQTRGLTGQRSVSAYLYLEPGVFPIEIRLLGKVVTPSDTGASVVCTPSTVMLKENPGQKMNATFQLSNRTTEDLAVKLVENGPDIQITLPATVSKGKSETGQIGYVGTGQPGLFESSLTVELTGNQGAVFRVTIPVVYGNFSFRPVFITREK